MGKKGSWISALKKAFTPSSKHKVHTGPDNYVKEKKWGIGRRRHGEINSFIPLYREPSSIEKILGDVQKDQQYKAHQVSYKNVQPPKSPTTRPSASVNTSTNVVSDEAETISSDRKKKLAQDKAKAITPSKRTIIRSSKSITSNYVHTSATQIQAAYRGYMARKSYRTLKGLVRLQKVMNGQSIKRQTMNAMRSMQLLVRIQTQIHARRQQMMENRNIHQHQISWRQSKETFNSLSKWNASNQLEGETHDEWDDSMLTKEERDASIKRKVEAVIKRERALAYAYSHQLLTVTPNTAHAALSDARSGGFPWWWNWLERQIPSDPHQAKTPPPPTPKISTATASAAFLRPGSRSKPAKTPLDASTPRSNKSLHTHNSSNRWQATHGRPAIRDDDSLTSCPAFSAPPNSGSSVPNYMTPTVSAKAKVRPTATESRGEGKEGRRKFSFALSQSIGSLRLFSAAKEAAPPPSTPATAASGRHRSTRSIGELSVDSTVSLPPGLGRRPFPSKQKLIHVH